MENIQEFVEQMAQVGRTPADEIVNHGVKLIKSNDVAGAKIVATVKRNTKTRKVTVLAYEEWSDGYWVKHTSEFNRTEGARQYTPRIRYSRPEQIVSLEEVAE